jgi:hypothetical protein
MEPIFALFLIVSGLIVFGIAAVTAGVDSRDFGLRGH